jgi:HTH-type transcriptional regulator/antitoxin HigA
MGFAAIKKKARDLFSEAAFISHINSDADYEQALALMDELIEDHDANEPLISILSTSIEQWENTADEFAEFNARIASMDGGIATLKLLMEQHNLGVADLPEIGSKSLVSKILNNKGRTLTKTHIAALSNRFGVSPALFF